MSPEDLATTRKAQLSPAKRALLEKLSGAKRSAGTTRTTGIPRRPPATVRRSPSPSAGCGSWTRWCPTAPRTTSR
ncbi:hypothetical protein SAZ11_02695 [Streptomyces sp. FXJ1.4098]|nr:hypothetical protein [Streptomyces sp. FXJ1.4098]